MNWVTPQQIGMWELSPVEVFGDRYCRDQQWAENMARHKRARAERSDPPLTSLASPSEVYDVKLQDADGRPMFVQAVAQPRLAQA